MKCPRCGSEMEPRPAMKKCWSQFKAEEIEVGFCPICREHRMIRKGEVE